MEKTITAIIGDLHIGGSTALAPPEYTIHNRSENEQQVLQHNRSQEWLWKNWLDFWDHVKYLTNEGGRRRKHRLVVVCLGDTLEGVHHNSPQLMQEVGDQIDLAVSILTPIRDGCDAFYGILGTGTHSGITQKDEIAVYNRIDATEHGQQLTLNIDGIVHDFAHHPGASSHRYWTSSAASIGAEVMLDYASTGMKAPNYIWRGHNHVIDDSGLKLPGTRVIFTPSWQLKTEYGFKVAANRARSDIGGFILDGSRLDDTRCRYVGQTDGRRVVKV